MALDVCSLLTIFELSQASLAKQCCDDSLFLTLMLEIPSFEDAAPHFGFTQAEISELRYDYQRERSRRLHMLWTWKRKNGSDATYLAIVTIFLKMNDRHLAEVVLKYYCKNQVNVPRIDSHVNPVRVSKYQNWDNMSKFEQEKIKNSLYEETQIIRKKYSFLTDDILNSMEKRGIEIDRLKLFLATYGVPAGESNAVILPRFESATTLAGVLLLMHMYYSSWFNIQLFKDVVERFGNDDDQSKFKEYKECDLVPYLRRSIFEIPSKSFGPGDITTGLISLHLFLPDDVIPTGQDVKIIRRRLCKLLGIVDGILQFIGYEEGSTILIFGVPEALLHNAKFEKSVEKYFAHDITEKMYTFSGDLAQVLCSVLEDIEEMEVATIPQSVFNIQSQKMSTFLRSEKATDYLDEHQIDAVFRVKDQLENPQNPNIALVVLPTGCGKTGVAVLAAFVLNASRVLVVTPSVKISQKIYEAFCGSNERHCFLRERNIVELEQENAVRPSGICITRTSEILQNMHFPFMVVNAHKIGGRSSVAIDSIPDANYDLVIVDEAHHYPAPTWKLLVDHFPRSRRLFLTATNVYKGMPILQYNPCFYLPRPEAVKRGIIRDIDFDELITPAVDSITVMMAIAAKVKKYLDQHDAQDPSVKHQAMVLTQTIETLNSAKAFKQAYNAAVPSDDVCEIYVSGSPSNNLRRFEKGEIRTLVIVGRLIEGFDNKCISVVAIARNVAPQSKVLFAQFVGRAVRKTSKNDPITAMIISHLVFNQRVNFSQFDQVTEEDNIDDKD